MHCKTRQVLRNLFSINQGNGSEVTFVAWATINSTSKIWKPFPGWMIWCGYLMQDINYILMEDLNLWPVLVKVLLDLDEIFLMHAMSINFTSLRWWCYLVCHCNLFVFLSSVSGFPSFKEHIFQGTPFSDCFQILHLRHGKRDLGIYTLFNVSAHPQWKRHRLWPNGKGIMASLEYTLMIYSPNGKGMGLWNIVFPSGNRHGKRKKRCIKKIQCRSKLVLCITGTTRVTWTRVKLPVAFEEFYMVYIFWLLLSLYYYCQLVQGQL